MMHTMIQNKKQPYLVEKLYQTQNLSDMELLSILESDLYDEGLREYAVLVRKKVYGSAVYIRGLIEISNNCRNNCFYCGIRKNNDNLTRYRLTKDEILSCCDDGYHLGFRTFVLQSGEDTDYSDDFICDVIFTIKSKYDDCAVTLSLGEKSRTSYQAFYNAGADRYLLRHETANENHYQKLHPTGMSLRTRKECLRALKEIGYQVGSGFMVGAPHQSTDYLIEDLRFLQSLQPDMIGIGPFIAHKDTPFRQFDSGSLQLCLRLISILRLMFPYALIPATTALGTIAPNGRELGLQSGANVVMPNLSPVHFRKMYALYDNKICTGEESAECLDCLKKRVVSVGYQIVVSRGDVIAKTPDDIKTNALNEAP